MARTRTKEQVCRECGGSGLISQPYSPGGNSGYIRFYETVCLNCDGVGVVN